MEFTTLTRTLNDCIAVFNGSYTRLAPYALALLGALLLIDIALTGSWTALGMFGAGDLIKHFFTLGAWTYVSTNFQFLAKTFVESVIQAGLVGGGMSGADHSLLLDPSKIAAMGLEVTEPVLAALDNASVFDKGGFGVMMIFGAGYLFLIACYFVMAIQVFIAVLEYYLILGVVGLLVPFGAWSPTRFISEKAIGAVIAAGIKLMVLSLVLAASGPILAKVTKSVAESTAAAGGHLTINGLLGSILGAVAVALLTWKAPAVASGLLGGSPSLSASDAARTVATAGSAATGAGAVAAAAGGMAVAASKGAITAGAKLAGAATTGARLGAATAGGGGLARFAGGAAGAVRGAGGAVFDGMKGLVARANPAPGIKDAFARGANSPIKAGNQPEMTNKASASSAPQSSKPTEGWTAQAGGYKPEPQPAKKPQPIHIGTEPAQTKITAEPGAGASSPPAAPAMAAASEAPSPDGGPQPPPPPAGGDPGPTGGGAAPALPSLDAPIGDVISPPAWANQASEQLRLMSRIQPSRSGSTAPPTA